jgi:hypothetical protein
VKKKIDREMEEWGERGQAEAPNFKQPIPNKPQSPEFKTKPVWSFEVGNWSLSVIQKF